MCVPDDGGDEPVGPHEAHVVIDPQPRDVSTHAGAYSAKVGGIGEYSEESGVSTQEFRAVANTANSLPRRVSVIEDDAPTFIQGRAFQRQFDYFNEKVIRRTFGVRLPPVLLTFSGRGGDGFLRDAG